MPHLVVDHAHLSELRRLYREWEDEDYQFDGHFDFAAWAAEVAPLLRTLADPRIELPDTHPASGPTTLAAGK